MISTDVCNHLTRHVPIIAVSIVNARTEKAVFPNRPSPINCHILMIAGKDYYDGESHYYIDGTVLDSGTIPVIKLDIDI